MKKYFEFDQNNSGGSFTVNKRVTGRLFIVASNKEEALGKAFGLGIYMDGVQRGKDCGCCGDRWSEPEEVTFPFRYGSMTKEEASKIAKKYKAKSGKTTWRFAGEGKPDPTQYDVIFPNVKSYAQFLADNYGWTSPDAYIYDGHKKVTIKGKKK